MNITTIIELENKEVEEITGAKLVFTQEQIEENIIETCVDCLQVEGTEEIITTENAMIRVFEQLKSNGVIPSSVQDFSFEMPSCERLKKSTTDKLDLPQRVILSFMS